MNRFEEMQVFTKVVETGTLTAAAEAMNIAKSAVSRRLTELEARLGVQLFIRSTRKLTLTETGRSFYERSVQILADVDETEALVSQSQAELRGHLKIALPSVFGRRHMGDALNDFIGQHPELKVELDFSDRHVDILQDGFDVAIRIGILEDSSLIARRITEINQLLAASPDYLDKYGVPKSPADLSKHRFLAYSLLRTSKIPFITPEGEQVMVQLPAAMRANSGEFLLQAGIAGHGLIWIPTFILHRAVEQGLLQPILQEYRWPSNYAHILYPRTRHLSARVRRFVDFIVARFEGVPPWDCKLRSMGYLTD